MIEALDRLGNLQAESLQEPEAAEKTLRKAVSLANTIADANLVAISEGTLGRVLVGAGKVDEGMKHVANAIAAMAKIINGESANTALVVECAMLHGFLGINFLQSDPTSATAQFTRQSELDRQALQMEPGSQAARQDLAGAVLQLAGLKRIKEEREALLRSGLQVLNEAPEPQRRSTAVLRLRASLLVRLAMESDHGKEALEFAREARKLFIAAAELEPLRGENQKDIESARQIIARQGGSIGTRPEQR